MRQRRPFEKFGLSKSVAPRRKVQCSTLRSQPREKSSTAHSAAIPGVGSKGSTGAHAEKEEGDEQEEEENGRKRRKRKLEESDAEIKSRDPHLRVGEKGLCLRDGDYQITGMCQNCPPQKNKTSLSFESPFKSTPKKGTNLEHMKGNSQEHLTPTIRVPLCQTRSFDMNREPIFWGGRFLLPKKKNKRTTKPQIYEVTVLFIWVV